MAVPREVGPVICLGSDSGCHFAYPDDATLAARHIEVQFHRGFDGWVVRDLQTPSGTRIEGERIATDRTHLLEDRGRVEVGGADTQLQLYLPETLYERMGGAGVTSRLGSLVGDAPTIRAQKRVLEAAPAPKRAPEPEPEELPAADEVLAWLCAAGQADLALRPGVAITIGRGESCVLRLEDDAVSRRHGLIRVTRAGQIVYTDRSSNGTLLNGGRVKAMADTPLKIGDRLEFGAIKVVVRAPTDPRVARDA